MERPDYASEYFLILRKNNAPELLPLTTHATKAELDNSMAIYQTKPIVEIIDKHGMGQSALSLFPLPSPWGVRYRSTNCFGC